jgi:dihydrofolate reductase
MRRINVTNNITLDGVMQAPGGKGEDDRGGFPHGGWAASYNDEVKGREMGAGMAKPGDMLFGRRTYEQFFRTWHGRTDNPFSPVLDKARKYVVSNSLREPLPWANSILLRGNGADAVAALKEDGGSDCVILGSGELVRSLLERGLIDDMVLLIHPLTLGTGIRLFADQGALAKFDLVKSVPTTKGVIIATYRLSA